MLITFSCPGCANITMFGDQAVTLLKLMGHSGHVPGTLLAVDIPASLKRLEDALAENKHLAELQDSEQTDDDEPPVSLSKRALPIIELLKSAKTNASNVMWDISSKYNTGI
ncbi:DUF1840 domain-containing protein [Neptunomonas qingdaonensis]|uniref:DUF1840 domain-containing protein n=1 Tax=Neptunomonas qingdaonensis TaxID=1045558 RepID=A0A1I2QVF5_9GAMM|nr:DUF1840 domain-containing protein [Neptunomonas qingdaonensis]SFG32344.1 protein of unknown function [Neptunomonas qingdaonensis]